MHGATVNEKIKARRLGLDIDENEMARRVRLTIYEYGDIESRAEEIISITPLYNVKKICAELNLDLLVLFGITCAFCEGSVSFSDDYLLSRNLLIKKTRQQHGLSEQDLGERIGFYMTEVNLLETYTAHLESWVLEDILWLSKLLKVPPQVLLDVRCSICGR